MLGSFQLNTVIIEVNQSDVTHFHFGAIVESHSKTVECSIIANTLQCHIHLSRLAISLQLQALLITLQLCGGSIFRGNFANNTDGQGCCVITFLLSLENFTKTGVGFLIALIIFDHLQSTGVEIVLGNIQHFCSFFQRTIIIVGTHATNSLMGKALSVVVLHL